MKKTNIEQWLRSGEYLPDVLRDFHDQKDTFKAIDELVEFPPETQINRPSWLEAQCYVIDVFLWWMARRGYTLQRTKRRGEFRDLREDVRAQTQRRNAAGAALIAQPLVEATPFPAAKARVASVPLQALAEQCDPYEGCWQDIDYPITLAEITAALAQNDEALTNTELTATPSPNARNNHIRKIAWFVRHGFLEPLELDVGVPCMGCQVEHIVMDGNHRLAAALYRQRVLGEDGAVNCEITGSQQHARYLGLLVERKEDAGRSGPSLDNTHL